MFAKEDWLRSTISFPCKSVPKILLLHGFVGSPFDLYPLIEKLKSAYDIFAPKLPLPEHNGNNTVQFTKEIFHSYQPDIVVGFSMGGALTMLLPSCPKIIIAPYRGLPSLNQLITNIARILTPIPLNIPKIQSGRIRSKKGRKIYEPGQWKFPATSFLALQELVKQSRTPTSNTPLLWIHSPSDPVACYEKAQKQWGAHAQHLCIKNAEHVLLFEEASNSIVSKCLDFCKENI